MAFPPSEGVARPTFGWIEYHHTERLIWTRLKGALPNCLPWGCWRQECNAGSLFSKYPPFREVQGRGVTSLCEMSITGEGFALEIPRQGDWL